MPSTTTDAARIKQQLETAFSGPAWHGPSLMENLKGVSAEVAAAKPILSKTNASVHSIWEIVNHLLAWQNETLEVLGGKPYASLQGNADWPPVSARNEAAWDAKVKELALSHERLTKRFDTLSDDELRAHVPGQEYSWRVLLRGIGNHTLYHAGQIGLLKRLSNPAG
jgi:uncharacterized damage-inducible protein DinB